jgi:hypothetical protein
MINTYYSLQHCPVERKVYCSLHHLGMFSSCTTSHSQDPTKINQAALSLEISVAKVLDQQEHSTDSRNADSSKPYLDVLNVEARRHAESSSWARILLKIAVLSSESTDNWKRFNAVPKRMV